MSDFDLFLKALKVNYPTVPVASFAVSFPTFSPNQPDGGRGLKTERQTITAETHYYQMWDCKLHARNVLIHCAFFSNKMWSVRLGQAVKPQTFFSGFSLIL